MAFCFLFSGAIVVAAQEKRQLAASSPMLGQWARLGGPLPRAGGSSSPRTYKSRSKWWGQVFTPNLQVPLAHYCPIEVFTPNLQEYVASLLIRPRNSGFCSSFMPTTRSGDARDPPSVDHDRVHWDELSSTQALDMIMDRLVNFGSSYYNELDYENPGDFFTQALLSRVPGRDPASRTSTRAITLLLRNWVADRSLHLPDNGLASFPYVFPETLSQEELDTVVEDAPRFHTLLSDEPSRMRARR